MSATESSPSSDSDDSDDDAQIKPVIRARSTSSRKPSVSRSSLSRVSSRSKSSSRASSFREWSVDKAIYEIGCGKFQYYIFAITGTIWAADAMEMMLLAFLLPELQKDWGLTGAESSLIGVSVFIGMLLGATSLASLSDKYGRKKIITIGTVSTAIFGVLSGIYLFI